MKCLIVSGGVKPKDEVIKTYSHKCDLIIGVDRGCDYLYHAKVKPNIIVGDFDSSKSNVIKELEDGGVEKFQYECEKNSTDSDIAFDIAISKKVDEIFFLGATGGRFDHALGNIGLLYKALKNNITASIIDDKNKIMIIDKNYTVIKDNEYKYVSFLAYNETVRSFTIKDAKYELLDYRLEIGDSRTVSNEFVKESIELEFSNGNILVIYSKD